MKFEKIKNEFLGETVYSGKHESGLPVVILCWALCLLCMVCIFSMSSQRADNSERSSGNTIRFFLRIFVDDFDSLPQEEQEAMIEEWQYFARKAAHFMIYALLGALFVQALFCHTDNTYIVLCGALLFTMLFAATDEFHQLFVPGRSGELRDVALDSGGAVLGALISLGLTKLISKIKNRRRAKSVGSQKSLS